MRFVFDIGIWYGPNDVAHRIITIDDPDITDPEQALWVIRDWQMDIGHSPSKDRVDAWPSWWKRPQNITSWMLLDT